MKLRFRPGEGDDRMKLERPADMARHAVNRVLKAGYGSAALYFVAGNVRARRLYDGLGFRAIYRDQYVRKRLSNPEKN